MAQSVVGALRVNLGLDSAAFTRGLKGAESKMSNFGRMVSRGLMAVGVAAAAAAGGLALSVRGTLNAADQMAKAARKIGIPIEELSRLKHAANLSGVSFQGLQNAVKRLSANMNDAKNGVGEAKDAFEQLGVSVTNSDGTLKSASQMLTELSAVFATMPDGAEKTALAMDLMGKSGADMIPMLNGGADALKSMMAEADQLGLVFTEEMGTNAEAFNDNMSRLGAVMGVLGRQLAAELAPHLAAFSDWLVANAPRIIEFSSALIDFGVNAVKAIADIVNAVTEGWQAFEQFWQGIVEWRNQVEIEVRAVADVIAQAFLELPTRMLEIGAQIMQGLLDGIRQKASEVTSYITGIANSIAQSARDALGIRSPSRVMIGVGENVMQGLGNGMEGMRGQVMGIASSIAGTLSGAFTSVITGAQSVKEALEGVLKQMASMLLNKAFNYFLNAAFGGGGGGGGLLGGLFGGLPGFARGGSFTVGGTGGTDSQLVAFRATPGEMVDVSTPGSGGAANSNVQVNIINNTGASVSQSSRRTANGQAIDVMIDDVVGSKIATPGAATSGAMKQQFGLRRGLAKR